MLRFLRNHPEAEKQFEISLRQFAQLSDPRHREDQILRTSTYHAVNLMDWKSPNAKGVVEEIVRKRFGVKLDEAGPAIAGSRDFPFVHHIYLRYAHASPGESWYQPYLDSSARWEAARFHPWELIDLYRGLLLFPQNPELATACFNRAVTTAFQLERTVVVIGLVVAAVGACLDAIDPTIADQALGRAVRESRRAGIDFDFRPVRDALEHPAESKVEGLLQRLPFNFR